MSDLAPTDVTLGEVWRAVSRMDKSLTDLSQTLGTAQNTLLERLDTKADKSDLARIEGRLDSHDLQLASLAATEHDREERAKVHQESISHLVTTRRQRWAIFAGAATVAASLCLAVVSVVSVLH